MPVNAMALTGAPAEVSFMWPFRARREPLHLERDDFSSNRHPALTSSWSMIFFRKPVSTPHQVRGRLFRDHALAPRSYGKGARWVQTLAVAASIAVMAVVAAAAQPGSAARPLKIVALGDSLTAGLGLPGDAAVPPRLERAPAGKGVAPQGGNAGGPGGTSAAGRAR